jgi:di/tricarboxylate transporter
MSWQGWFTLSVTLLAVIAMARGKRPELVFACELSVLFLTGVIDAKAALAGFANEGVWTVGLLFVVASAMRETGAMDVLARSLLGQPKTVVRAQLRLMLPVASLSAFLNNTPIVAMMVPVVSDWSRRLGMPASKLMMPLSFATILGGTCTLIGTSTNVVAAALAEQRGLSVGLFELSAIGVPAAIAGLLYIVVAQRWLLPARAASVSALADSRQYTLAMRVEPESSVVGVSIEQAGLRHLPGLYLVQIEREGESLTAVGPSAVLRAADVLVFVGVVDSVRDLLRIKGLVPENDQVDHLQSARHNRRLCEAVVSGRSDLVGKNVRDARFRTHYGAAIVAVHRDGQRVAAKIGDIVLEPGDALLLEAAGDFAEVHGRDRSFALVRTVDDSAPVRHERALLASAIVVAMIVSNAFGVTSLLQAALLASLALLFTRCGSLDQARRAFDVPVLASIAASFAIGEALAQTGVAHAVAEALVFVSANAGGLALISGVYLVTVLLNAFVSNNASVVLMFPIAMEVAEQAGLPMRGVLFLLMMAGSADFATPIGYQTNLMVYGPGGYRFMDFVRFGLPLQAVVAAVTIAFCWLRFMT